jgi:hypothetical protein
VSVASVFDASVVVVVDNFDYSIHNPYAFVFLGGGVVDVSQQNVETPGAFHRHVLDAAPRERMMLPNWCELHERFSEMPGRLSRVAVIILNIF